MQYIVERLDRSTGELVETHEEWITATELGREYGMGPRKIREVLHHMGLLQREGRRYRLTHASVRKGYGKRIENSRSGKPFDVLSPHGQRLIAEAWETTVADLADEQRRSSGVDEARAVLEAFEAHRKKPLSTQEKVCWLLDHYHRLTHDQIAEISVVCQSIVSRYARTRDRQRSKHFREAHSFS